MVYIYTNVQLCFNFIFIIVVTSFNFETQIIYMWSLKLFKVGEILCVVTFDSICNSKFATNCVDRSLPTPFVPPPKTNMSNMMKLTFFLVKSNTTIYMLHVWCLNDCKQYNDWYNSLKENLEKTGKYRHIASLLTSSIANRHNAK